MNISKQIQLIKWLREQEEPAEKEAETNTSQGNEVSSRDGGRRLPGKTTQPGAFSGARR